jgi:hypothetical protein
VRGRTLFLALVAVLSLLSATAVAGGHRVVQGTKGGDELTMGDDGNRVFARAGDDTVDGGAGDDRLRGGRGDDTLFGGDDDDRLRGGQDSDYLDGGEGDDYLNGGGDGRDKDKIVCGDGYDVVVLGRNDVVLVEVAASEEGETPTEDADGCEKVKGPGGEKGCASTKRECGEGVERPCASTNRGCEDPPAEEPCVATYDACEDPPAVTPEPDEPVEQPADEPGEY